jgi:hypothetical protein
LLEGEGFTGSGKGISVYLSFLFEKKRKLKKKFLLNIFSHSKEGRLLMFRKRKKCLSFFSFCLLSLHFITFYLFLIWRKRERKKRKELGCKFIINFRYEID